jgi:cell wall-associated NlpC family hydrolase
MKARRAIINKTPKIIREPLARAFLPPETPPAIPIVTTADAVVSEARTWVGVPFRHQGRDRSGVDCIGLPIVVLRQLGVPEFEPSRDYPRAPNDDTLLHKHFLRFCTPLPDAVPGCAIALKAQRTFMHVAILTDTDTLIHVLEKHGQVIEHGFRGMWKTRFASGNWALPGVRY